MPIRPNGTPSGTVRESQGGSPRGWTFIGTASCWRRFFLKYVFGLYPVDTAEALQLGAAFHLFMEGKSKAEVAQAFPEHVVEAERLATVRKTRGPPLPKATAIEEEFPILDGMMTSKPDRIEQVDGRVVVRDFKTSAFFSENDDAMWGVDMGILGECIAADTDTAYVDITTKRANVSGPAVKVVKVTLTPSKRAAMQAHVEDFWAQLEKRATALAKKKPSAAALDDVAPKNLSACVGKYGPCPYYARCWGKAPESMLYKLTEKAPARWADYAEGPQPRTWTAGKVKVLDVLQSATWRKVP